MHQYPRILVGTDFTPCSAVAIRQAMRLAAGSGASGSGRSELRVVHVIDTLVAMEIEEALTTLQKDITEGLKDDARRAWAAFAANVDGAIALPFEVLVDNRVAGIVRTAQRGAFDLVVLGAFGHSQPDVGVGTVATACVRKSMADVLLVRDTRPRDGASPFTRVLAAVDFSPTSLRALQRAVAIAARDGAELHVVHVFEAPWHHLHYRAPTPQAAPAFRKQYVDALHGRLEAFCRPVLEQAGLGRTSLRISEHGGHRSTIVAEATAIEADLIALGTRGRTTLRDILLGTTAEKVLRESACSVLAVKPAEFTHPLTTG